MPTSDLDLLREYTEKNSDDAFATLVKRHLNLVYSAALRQVRSPQLAEEVSQSVFTDLARDARRLAGDSVLSAWLYAVTHRTAIDVVRREVRRQLREQIATELNTMNATATDWTHIEPLLDETDRTAVLLRYFENKSLREVGSTLGTSDDAAQKRVSRAVERLREFFAKRGVTVGASGLVLVLTANAVQAAPLGLAVNISTAALAGTTFLSTATATAAKAIAMTTLQKALVTLTFIAAVGTGFYEARQTSALQTQLQNLQQQHNQQIQQLQRERDDGTNRLASLLAENEKLKSHQSATELLRLRGEVTRLHQARAESSATPGDPREDMMKTWLAKEDTLKEVVKQNPNRTIPELQLLSDQQWLDAAIKAKFDTDKNVRKSLSNLRNEAESTFATMTRQALSKYMDVNGGQFPTDLSQLQQYFSAPVDAAILNRWEILPQSQAPHSGISGDWVITEKAPVDAEMDQHVSIGQNQVTSNDYETPELSAAMTTLDPALKAYAAAHNGANPGDPSQILPYLTSPEQQAAYQTVLQKKKAGDGSSQ